VGSAEVIKETGSEILVRAYPNDPEESPAEDIIRFFKAKEHPVGTLFVEEGRLDDVFRAITLSNHTP